MVGIGKVDTHSGLLAEAFVVGKLPTTIIGGSVQWYRAMPKPSGCFVSDESCRVAKEQVDGTFSAGSIDMGNEPILRVKADNGIPLNVTQPLSGGNNSWSITN
jgi:hypothetical protein